MLSGKPRGIRQGRSNGGAACCKQDEREPDELQGRHVAENEPCADVAVDALVHRREEATVG